MELRDLLEKELREWQAGNIKPNPAFILLSHSFMNQLKREVSQMAKIGIDNLCTFKGIILKTPDEILDLTEIESIMGFGIGKKVTDPDQIEELDKIARTGRG